MPEKNAQVRIMRDIYRNSSQTTVWLNSAANARLAHEFIGQLARTVLLKERKHIDLTDHRPVDERNVQWASLRTLLQHPYWERIWVVQEVATSASLRLLYGGQFIGWKGFVMIMREIISKEPGSLLQVLDTTEGASTVPFFGVSQVCTMDDIRDTYQNNKDIPLSEMLLACLHFQDTDGRDHIFALQGITSAANQNALIPDYSLYIQYVYIATAQFVLQSNQPFSLLPLASLALDPIPDDLPSWVPDWRKSPVLPPLSHISVKPDFQAGANTLSNIAFKLRLLGIEGVIVDEIRVVRQVRPIPIADMLRSDINQQEHFARVPPVEISRHGEAQHLANKHSPNPYFNKQSRREALWRTLICDSSREKRPAEDGCGDSYRQWVDMLPFAAGAYSPELPLGRYFTSYIEALMSSVGLADEDRTKILGFMNVDPPKLALRGINLDGSLDVDLARLTPEELKPLKRLTQLFDERDKVITQQRFAFLLAKTFAVRQFAVTSKGYMALVPWGTEPGDIVYVFLGAATPFLLRHARDDTKDLWGGKMYQLVGEAYVHGIMNGEVFKDAPEREWFWLR